MVCLYLYVGFGVISVICSFSAEPSLVPSSELQTPATTRKRDRTLYTCAPGTGTSEKSGKVNHFEYVLLMLFGCCVFVVYYCLFSISCSYCVVLCFVVCCFRCFECVFLC